MDGNQIGYQKRPVQLFRRGMQFLCIYDDRDRYCNPLVTASGIDDNRQLTPAHTRIGTGSRHGLGPRLHICAAGSEQDASYICSPIVFDSLFGNCIIIRNLSVQNLLHIRYLRLPGKGYYLFNGKAAAVGFAARNLTVLPFPVQKHFTVLFHTHNIGMAFGNPHNRFLPFCRNSDPHIQLIPAFQRFHHKTGLLQIFPDLLSLDIRNLCNHLQDL